MGVRTDGPCVAYRKAFWEDINEWEDVDQIITLFAKKKGFLTVQANNAVCYDKANETSQQEMRQRSRMTRKAMLSTFGRWQVKEWFRYPIFTFALFSHKIVRFLSPVFLIIFFLALLGIICIHGLVIESLMICSLIIATIVVGKAFKISLFADIYNTSYSFIFANIAFLLGLIQWARGMQSGKYKPTRMH